MEKVRTKLEQSLGLIVLGMLLLGCLIVLTPFISALLWAIILSFSSWPIYQRLLRWSGGRRTLVALLMTLGMVVVFLLPFVIVGSTLAENVKEVSGVVRKLVQEGPPAPPAWLAKVPVVGQRATDYWQSLAEDTAKLWQQAQKLIEPISAWLLRVGLVLGSGVLQLALSVFLAFFLFRDGAALVQRLDAAIDRIAGSRGQHLLTIAGNTVRGVVYGILGTALIQAILAGIGYFIAGLPGVGLLTLLTFFFSIVPGIGTALVWVPAALWLFHQGSNGWGIFMIVWGLGVGSVDNFVKPWLISQGSDMPFVLIFFGVIGGALTFGFIGVFLGPTLLAVGYRLIEEFVAVNQPSSTTTMVPTKPSLASDLHQA
jgi:predicted PurR-regulated permease PerM